MKKAAKQVKLQKEDDFLDWILAIDAIDLVKPSTPNKPIKKGGLN